MQRRTVLHRWAIAAIVLTAPLFVYGEDAKPDRFESTIRKFEASDAKDPPKPNGVLFTGSSSVRMWNLGESFPKLGAINRGFGGSTLPEVLHYFDRVVVPYRPRTIAIYCGDNDINKGRTPEQVFADFVVFVDRVRRQIGEDVSVVYIAIKPSRARWKLWPKMARANALIAAWASTTRGVDYADIATPMLTNVEAGSPPPADLFVEDGLHLSAKGYTMWTRVLAPLVGDSESR
ncbi:MAG: hypothetical protein H8E63_10305 [Proteobacteria bacterium]|nr:hypothetical protein [Pseudomonadota bacterium]